MIFIGLFSVFRQISGLKIPDSPDLRVKYHNAGIINNVSLAEQGAQNITTKTLLGMTGGYHIWICYRLLTDECRCALKYFATRKLRATSDNQLGLFRLLQYCSAGLGTPGMFLPEYGNGN